VIRSELEEEGGREGGVELVVEKLLPSAILRADLHKISAHLGEIYFRLRSRIFGEIYFASLKTGKKQRKRRQMSFVQIASSLSFPPLQRRLPLIISFLLPACLLPPSSNSRSRTPSSNSRSPTFELKPALSPSNEIALIDSPARPFKPFNFRKSFSRKGLGS